MNAAERIANGYEAETTRAAQELSNAETQLRDYQARQGAVFAHEEYQQALKALRDQLKDGLSAKSEKDGLQPDEIVCRIKALRDSHTVETGPRRTTAAITRAAEPVTARIRRNVEERFHSAFVAPGSDRLSKSFQEQEADRLAAKIHEVGQGL